MARRAARRAVAPTALLACGAAFAAVGAARRLAEGFLLPRASGSAGSAAGAPFEPRATLRRLALQAAASEEPFAAEPALAVALRRREALAAAAAAAVPLAAPLAAAGPALAEGGAAARQPAQVKRVVVNLADDDSLKKEVKFWQDALNMKTLGTFVGADGLKSTVVGFGAESSNSGGTFGIELKVNPETKDRPSPRQLSQDLQPTVDALTFIQVGFSDKVKNVFSRTMKSGGVAIFGDSTYLDMESPRGVPVRFINRGTEQQAIEMLCLNIEVPAFEAVTKMYKRGLGLSEEEINDDDPPVQKRSVLLRGQGGPSLLLSPVPDGRLKDRQLDFFENLVAVSSDVEATSKVAEQQVVQTQKDREEYEAKFEAKYQTLQGEAKERYAASIEKYRKGTIAKPEARFNEGGVQINDGVGNWVYVSSASAFDKVLAGALTAA